MLPTTEVRWMKFRYDGSSYEIKFCNARGVDALMIYPRIRDDRRHKPKLNRKWTPPKSHGYN